MGAPRYDEKRIDLIRRLMPTTPLDDLARIIGTSRDAVRVWLGRHAKAHGIAYATKPRSPKTVKPITPPAPVAAAGPA
jgi:hypothetical protein